MLVSRARVQRGLDDEGMGGALLLTHARRPFRDGRIKDIRIGALELEDAAVAVAVLDDADRFFENCAEGAPQGRALVRWQQ